MRVLKFTVQVLLSVLIVALIIIMLIPDTRAKVLNFFNPDKVEIVQEKGDVEEVTIQDVLEFRKEILETEYYDSVFLHMPEIPLIAILIKGGTKLSNYEIAKEYLDNKKSYDDVEFGAQITEIYKQHIQKEPDELPTPPLPDSITVVDTDNNLP